MHTEYQGAGVAEGCQKQLWSLTRNLSRDQHPFDQPSAVRVCSIYAGELAPRILSRGCL